MLRRALIEKGVEYCCSKCGQGPEWLGHPLTLDVDHIDGDWSDSQLNNLRFLCPNCHSQFSRGLIGKVSRVPGGIPRVVRVSKGRAKDECPVCGGLKYKRNKHCSTKCAVSTQTKVDWGSVDLEGLLGQYNLTQIGKILGVSATAIKKRMLKLEIPTPSRSSLHLKSRKPE